MDGITLVEEMVNAADRVIPKVWERYQAEALSGVTLKGEAHALLGAERGDPWSRKKATVAMVNSMLELQGWKFIGRANRWRSPVWLFPPVMLKKDTLVQMVEEEVDLREGNTPMLTAGDDFDPVGVLNE